ncbi:hypothetical protein BELL_0156g00120 [Botrytis elliptica]|uniref:Uncharacterized protein n=1 Tax=Botrytis elliptica TaxID=278938 RepID=A0A4Z1JS18_9HELO|nr:hypothetical protein BELL_0156g00120 [Botrytis elliptica]
MSRLSKYMTSYFRKTPQAPQSPRQSIELGIVDANGRPLISPKANEILDEIENGILVQEKSVVVNGAIAPYNCGEEIPQEPDDQQQLADSIADFQVDSIADFRKNLWYLILIFIFNSLAIFWAVNRIRRFTTPLENQKFTEGEYRKHEQNLCFLAAAVLFVLNSISWGSNLDNINECFRIYLGLSLHWSRRTSGTCDSFDTRIKLSDPYVDYFGLHNRTTKEGRIYINHQYTQTPGLYPYPSWKDYESYKSGVDLFNITRINNTALNNPTLSTSKPFDKFWRIMGIYGDKPLHLDFDLLHRSWRMKEGIIVIDSEDPSSSFYKGGVLFDRLKPGDIYDSNKTSHLVPNFGIAIHNLHEVRNGTWTATDSENMELEFPELDLHIPMWGLFEKHCVYQSFMRVFRRPTDEIRKTWNTWSKESNGEEVMRTASFGDGTGVRRGPFGAVGVDGCGEEEYEDGTGEDEG